MKEKKGEIIIYKTGTGKASIKVNLEDETVWLSQKQMAELFGKDVRTINEHIIKVYKEGELQRKGTIRNFRIVQKEGSRKVERKIEFYNLDVIISVGYRVKSKRGTQFRVWATKTLKDHLLKGYTENRTRLKELKQTIKLLKKVVDSNDLKKEESEGLLKVITDYNYALDILDQYDHDNLEIKATTKKRGFVLEYERARSAIDSLKEKTKGTDIFGNEKDQSFKSSLGAIYQTYAGKELYPSIEEKGAHLLYFVVKNHSFTDGNKRIAAFLFIWFLQENKLLYTDDGEKRIADNALVALTLLIAESAPKEKEIMVKVVVNLINKKI